MANPEHVRIVKQGSGAVDEWRENHKLVTLDLSEENLTGADLTGAELSWANLSGAKLSRANLSWARLKGANLVGANLIETVLTEANLADANLADANLADANLSGAILFGTTLSGGRMDGMSLELAILGYTQCGDLDLSETTGLETVEHKYPSTIGIDTLCRSKGTIPDVFLRGCGVPEDFITYLPSLLGKTFEFYSCFLSYSSKDEEFAKRLHARLQQEKLRVWFAPEDMQGGRKSFDQIDQAIRLHDKLLVVLSVKSMASEWVKTEIRRGRQAEIRDNRQKLFPVRLVDMKTIEKWKCIDPETGKDLAVEVREYHIPDFSEWKDHDRFEASFQKLLKDLRRDELPSAVV